MEPGGARRCPGCDIARVNNLHHFEKAATCLKDASQPLKGIRPGSLFSVFSWISFVYLLGQTCLATHPWMKNAVMTCVLKLSAKMSQMPLYCDCFFPFLFFLKVQTAIEELLSIGCGTEPASAKILFHNGFEKEGSDFLWQISSLLWELISFDEVNVLETCNDGKCALLMCLST